MAKKESYNHYSDIPAGARVLVAPLCWGLGHATRCIPVVRHLLDKECYVIIASDGEALVLLKKEFPSLPWSELPGYNIDYTYRSMSFNMLLQSGKIISTIIGEFRVTKKLIVEHDIDIILSDNRYGVRDIGCHNIILCHQLHLQENNVFVRFFGNRMHGWMLSRYDQIWVPDLAGKASLAGKLSNLHGFPQAVYIGLLSRMKKKKTAIERKYLVILSGPEPRRTMLEEKLIDVLDGEDFLLIRGVLSDQPTRNPRIVNYLTSRELEEEIHRSETIICRSGYSSIMDLATLAKNAILIPTPGQSEQEYLGAYHKRMDTYSFQVLEEKDLTSEVFSSITNKRET